MRLLGVYGVPAAALIALAQLPPKYGALLPVGVVIAMVWMLVASRLVK